MDNGGKIISLSLGQERQEGTDPLACPTAEQDAILYAIAKGAIVVAASGNEGENGSPVTDPGVCIGVVAVGAVDSNDEVAPFSSRHPYLTVTAPGVEIPTLSRVSGEAYIGQGTSQATAIVSAGLAVIWSKYPDLTNHQVVARMMATLARPVTTPTADPAYGFGILDVGAAISAAVPADAANPVLAAAAPFLDRAIADAAVIETPPEPVEAARHRARGGRGGHPSKRRDAGGDPWTRDRRRWPPDAGRADRGRHRATPPVHRADHNGRAGWRCVSRV